MAENASMLWVDLETTGLVANDEVILELALIVTDRWGEIIAGESWLVEDSTTRWKDTVQRAKSHPIVGPMHDASGLWNDLYNTGGIPTSLVEERALCWLDDQEIPHGALPICGNSIRLDRDFLNVHMPQLEYHFHYRMIDISTVKELCKRLNPRVFSKSPKERQSAIPHRGYADLLSSIEEYKFYVDNFLWTE